MRAQEFQPEPIYYFAYGMLTNPRHMPGAEAVGAAVLPNHSFEFYQYADVVPAAGEQVHGMLWQVPRELLSQLDRVEGVPWLYNRKTVPVRSGGQRYEAYVYTMTPAAREAVKDRMPSRNYVRTLGQGYAQFGLPGSQINQAIENSRSVQEVAMNPAAYADSMTAAAEKGVLIGFEFEVYVPESTMSRDNRQKPEKPGFDYFWQVVTQDEDTDLDLGMFDQLFRVKQPFRYDGRSYSSMKELVDHQRDKDLDFVRETFGKLPKVIRERILTRWRRRRASREATESEFMDWLSDEVGGLLADPDSWEELVPLRRWNQTWNDLYRIRRATRDQSSQPIIRDVISDMSVQKFQNTFEYDDAALKARYRQHAESLDDDDDDYEYNLYPKAARVLKPAVEATMGARVKVFNSYHQANKNMTDWYIEPDGSLDYPRNNADAGAEIVSPPLPVNEAMSALKKFYGMARELDLYTNESTGLHINVSIPDQLDVLKLAMFLGDEYVLQAFDREDSEYARSVLQNLQRDADPAMIRKRRGRTELDVKALQRLAKDYSRSHFASISDNGKYISFRHAGGDYLNRSGEITDLVGRFVRAMVIAADPQAYRQEYLKKLTKMVGSRDTEQTQITAAVIQDIRRQGVPVLTVDTWSNNYPAFSSDIEDEVMAAFDSQGMFIEQVRASADSIAQSFAGVEVTGGRSVKWARFRVVPTSLADAVQFLNKYLVSSAANTLQRNPRLRMRTDRIPLNSPNARHVVHDIQDRMAQLKRSQVGE